AVRRASASDRVAASAASWASVRPRMATASRDPSAGGSCTPAAGQICRRGGGFVGGRSAADGDGELRRERGEELHPVGGQMLPAEREHDVGPHLHDLVGPVGVGGRLGARGGPGGPGGPSRGPPGGARMPPRARTWSGGVRRARGAGPLPPPAVPSGGRSSPP